jgi:anti-sigma-K factor RskA
VDKLVQQDAPELERRLTELQSQINRLSLSLHLWQERQDRQLEQRLTDWSALEARAQKDASTRMRELQETIEHEWSELRQVQRAPQHDLRELESSLGQKLTDLTEQVHAVVTELRANGAIRTQALQPATPSWPLEDVVRLHNQLRDGADSNGHGDQALATRASLVVPDMSSAFSERLETLERAVSEQNPESERSIATVWRVAVVLLAVGVGVAGFLVSRLQGQVSAATARVSQAELQAQAVTKTATEQIAAARQEASQQIAQAREAAEKAQTISDVLAAPDMVKYNLVGGDGTTFFSAQALVSRSRGFVFSESRLPPVAKDSTYQIWLMSNGQAASVGTFSPDASGRYSMTTTAWPQGVLAVTSVLVTVERAGGNSAPTGRLVLSRPQPAPTPAATTTP